MSAFSFRLQKVLDLRVNAEREALARLAAAVADLERREKDEAAFLEGRMEAWRQLHGCLAALPPSAVEGLLQQAGRMDQGLEAARAARGRATDRVEEARDHARRKQNERKAMETLKDRALEIHALEDRRREGRDMDETAGMRHARGSRGGDRS